MERDVIFQTFAICKNYKDFKALDNVSMTIHEGDIYGFVGENGAGKTTLIRIASGLIHPTSGDYALFGVSSDSSEIENVKKQTAAIVEAVALNKGMTALENLRLQCYLAGIEKTDEQLIELIKDVGLDPTTIEKKKSGAFSLGMRQRLGLAIALVGDPKFVLLDEPMNGLDPQGFVDMREAILNLNKKGVTFLISSHILSELDKICTCVGFLSHGRLLKELSTEELHDKARHKIIINVKKTDKVKRLLVEYFKLKEVKTEGNARYIYDLIDINDVISFLVANKIIVNGIYATEETIEDFYRELMGMEGSL